MKKSITLIGSIVVGCALVTTPTQARTGVKIGTLVCNIEGGIGLVLGSSKDMRCTLHKLNGKVEHYTGVVRKFGLDIGVTGKAKMAWTVFAPGRVNKYALRGTYVGAAVDASLGVGGGGKVLVGGFNKSLTLQPVSVQAQTGANIAAGVSTLVLR